MGGGFYGKKGKGRRALLLRGDIGNAHPGDADDAQLVLVGAWLRPALSWLPGNVPELTYS